MSKAGARGAAIVQGVVTTAGQEAGLKVAVEKVGDRGLYGRGKRDGRGEAAESRAPGTDASRPAVVNTWRMIPLLTT